AAVASSARPFVASMIVPIGMLVPAHSRRNRLPPGSLISTTPATRNRLADRPKTGAGSAAATMAPTPCCAVVPEVWEVWPGAPPWVDFSSSLLAGGGSLGGGSERRLTTTVFEDALTVVASPSPSAPTDVAVVVTVFA